MVNRILTLAIGFFLLTVWSATSWAGKSSTSNSGTIGEKICQIRREKMPNAERRDRQQEEERLKAAETETKMKAGKDDKTTDTTKETEKKQQQQKFGSKPPSSPSGQLPND